MTDRNDPETEALWAEFHEAVNMNSQELRTWLLTEAAGPDGMPADPDMGLDERGRRIVRLLRKRKVDLTGDDVEVMREVRDEIRDLLSRRPENGAADEEWRHALMDLGHTPSSPPRPARAGR
ncbi:DUF3140 domain-containing protein [Actinomadura parmotrematis]|uniref:DUF3140 domain-containing protein n=1 Tax=Actinomadura parmotrematis TaxID=2864039 RepID=A0ABS7G291_9ACTN|nr:DUF3140 domain-containing protein [Actinomadura parmotrematis]MBW8486596.1 DUF3140 domain-containing protein [Actinomadura parmotrematis]